MSDKERLEEIQNMVWRERCTYAVGNDSSREGYRYTLSDEDYEWLIKQAEKTEKYREALEEITKVDLSDGKSREHYQTEAVYMKITALKALEG